MLATGAVLKPQGIDDLAEERPALEERDLRLEFPPGRGQGPGTKIPEDAQLGSHQRGWIGRGANEDQGPAGESRRKDPEERGAQKGATERSSDDPSRPAPEAPDRLLQK